MPRFLRPVRSWLSPHPYQAGVGSSRLSKIGSRQSGINRIDERRGARGRSSKKRLRRVALTKVSKCEAHIRSCSPREVTIHSFEGVRAGTGTSIPVFPRGVPTLKLTVLLELLDVDAFPLPPAR